MCPGTEGSCACHPVIDPNDWFPMQQLQDAFKDLQKRLMQKIGLDLTAVFSEIQGGRFSVIRLEYPYFYPNGLTWNKSSGHVNFDIERLASDYGTVVTLVRTLILALLFVSMVRVVLVTFRQY